MESNTVLIVDDDTGLSQQVALYLEDYGLNVLTAESGQAMDLVLAGHTIDVVVLDLAMPGEDGLSICRRLKRPNRPGILMASVTGTESDRIRGLDAGADDYIAKPFSPRELLARIRALLRVRAQSAATGIRRGQRYAFQGFVYDPGRRQVAAPSGATILLTAGEATLLNTLLAAPGVAHSRDDLNAVDPTGLGRGADITVSRLRRKLEAHGGTGVIKTEWGAGYMIDGAVERQ